MSGLTVFIDPCVAPEVKQRALITQALADIGIKCEFVAQRVEKTISWQTDITEQKSVNDDVSKETMAVIYAQDMVPMVHTYLQKQCTDEVGQMTLTDWVRSIQHALPGQNLTILAVGMSKYFSAQKLRAKHKHREAVTGQAAVKGRKKKGQHEMDCQISQEQLEEALVELQLFTGCIIQPIDSDEELANQIKLFTKAVAEKPNKKDRLNNVFSFLDEGSNGLKVTKEGEGLKQVWKRQLMQFKNLGPEMAEAICNVYPSPHILHQACKNGCAGAESEKMIADINVRRNASIIATNRKVGKEQARRIHLFMSSRDPKEIIK